MKIVVIGGTGLIGSKLVDKLRQRRNDVLPASPASGVNTLTGEGLPEALAGAQVVVDVSNSPSFEDAAVLNFFETSSRNLLAAEAAAGVRHHVALSVVGTDRLQQSGYFRAKLVQENLIKASPVPYTILRSTQFFEFLSRIAQPGGDDRSVRVSTALAQPIASDDAVAALADIVMGVPADGTVEVAGPERLRLVDLVRRALAASHDSREVIASKNEPYFGARLDDRSLIPGKDARIGATRFENWLDRSRLQKLTPKAMPSVSPASAA